MPNTFIGEGFERDSFNEYLYDKISLSKAKRYEYVSNILFEEPQCDIDKEFEDLLNEI